ncbi:MAG: hypothetical protein Q8M07_04655 [Prosthecobacter sp.]|nr:hypothetical protein [Prosthecobacter sp.]
MKATLLASLTLPLLLTQCLDPMMHGPQGGYPYGDPNQRLEMRERGTDLNRMAYERGWQDGQMDAQQRQAKNYGRHTTRFDRNTVLAYRDGYSQGYTQSQQGSPSGLQWPGAGAPVNPLPPQQQQPPRDPAYNQGYDYGLRDRTSGRVADPAAHVGRYDPRYRSSFERGYHDAFGAGSSSFSSGTGGQWFR